MKEVHKIIYKIRNLENISEYFQNFNKTIETIEFQNKKKYINFS